MFVSGGSSRCRAWRCRNSRAVAQGAGLGATTALLQDLCGIQPAEPGFAAVRIAPQPGPLTSLSGTQPGPDGNYSITLEKRDGEWLLQLCLPSPRRVILDTAFAPAAREALVDGAPLLAQESVILPNGSEAARFVWNAGMLSEVPDDLQSLPYVHFLKVMSIILASFPSPAPLHLA